MDNIANAVITSDRWFQDAPQEPRKCRMCGKGWVPYKDVVCPQCKPIYKYKESHYYYHRFAEIQALDMGVAVWQ